MKSNFASLAIGWILGISLEISLIIIDSSNFDSSLPSFATKLRALPITSGAILMFLDPIFKVIGAATAKSSE